MGEKIAAAIYKDGGINRGNYIEGENSYITWTNGVIVGLCPPEMYSPSYKIWKREDLPIIPENFILTCDPSKTKLLSTIRTLADSCNIIVNACDSGVMGQVIFDYLYDYLKLTQPVRRLWTASLTVQAIRDGFRNLRDNKDYHSLFLSGKARDQADYLIGINGTRVASLKYTNGTSVLSIGRVQMPTLSFIYDRTIEIENHQKKTFYEVIATFKQGEIEYKGKWQGDEIDNIDKAREIADKTKNANGKITSYEQKDTKVSAPKLYDLTLLQYDANKLFGFTAKKTLEIAQQLYENRNAITYPRTNSNYVTEHEIPMMREVFRNISQIMKGAPFFIYAKEELVNEKNKRICRNDLVEDHHAIIPTEQAPKELSDDEKKIYLLVLKRFLAQFFPPAQYLVHEIITEIKGEPFYTKVKESIDLGWKLVYLSDKSDKNPKDEDSQEENEIEVDQLNIDENDSIHCIDSQPVKKETKPPRPYTEGTLLKAMETCGKNIDDENLKEALKDKGIGTPATRDAIIERLKEVGYITLKGKSIYITEKGRKMIEILRQIDGIKSLTSPALTGQWEEQLNKIAKGNLTYYNIFMKSIVSFTQLMINEFDKSKMQVDFTSKTGLICPNCHSEVTETKLAYNCTKKGDGDNDCKFTIWKKQYGKALTEKQLHALITKGETDYLKFESKNKKKYEAKIRIKDRKSGNTELVFKNQQTTNTITSDAIICKCPKCAGDIKDKGTLYGCTNYPKCDFNIPKSLLKRPITPLEVEQLCNTRSTHELSGFVSKKNRPFSAKLILNDQLKLEFKFPAKSKLR